VKAHLEKIIADPKLVTGADMTIETSTLNGRRWEKPEVVYAAQHRISEWKLDHVDGLVVMYDTAKERLKHGPGLTQNGVTRVPSQS
jgi:hypothetical protein